MRVVASLLLVAFAMAGCAGTPGAPTEGLPFDEKGRTLPSVFGVVVDPAIRPLAGVEVRLLETNTSTLTDEQGRYALFHPTGESHRVLVIASKEGYSTQANSITVSAHSSFWLDIGLEIDEYFAPRMDILQSSSTLQCYARVTAAGQTSGAPCGATIDPNASELDEGIFIWSIDPEPGLAGIVVEVYWEADTPFSESLEARLVAPMAGGQGGEIQVELVGASPLRLEIPQDIVTTFPRWTSIQLEVQLPDPAGGGGPAGVAVSVDQTLDAYASLFYVDPAPAGYVLE